MFTTGSKLLIGSAAAAWVLAAIYGIAQGGILGSIGLISAATALSLLAGINVFTRDANVPAMDPDAFEVSPAARADATPSLWPLVVAVGATTLTLGLVSYRAIFVLGLIAIIAGAIEWLIQGWSERASADRGYNASARDVLADPLELPVVASAGAGVVVFAFSRVMLGLPSKTSAVVAFSVAAALVLAVGAVIGTKRRVSKSTLTGALSIAAIVLVGGGAVAGLNGERDTHIHETPGMLAADDACGTDETEADERASQTVAAKANQAADVIFDGATLVADASGFDGKSTILTLPRSNPNNILFRNESSQPARLVIELHPAEGSEGPERLCSAIVEEGGVQLLTVIFERPSFAIEEGFAFEIAGSDVTLDVVVP